MNLNNIRLLVVDFDTCFKFYKNTLGLHCSYGNPGGNFASFDIGMPGGLCIFKAELMNGALAKNTKTIAKNTNDKFAIIIEVDDVDKTTEDLKKKKIKFVSEPKDMTVWGIRVAHFRDPEDNLIELYSNLLNR